MGARLLMTDDSSRERFETPEPLSLDRYAIAEHISAIYPEVKGSHPGHNTGFDWKTFLDWHYLRGELGRDYGVHTRKPTAWYRVHLTHERHPYDIMSVSLVESHHPFTRGSDALMHGGKLITPARPDVPEYFYWSPPRLYVGDHTVSTKEELVDWQRWIEEGLGCLNVMRALAAQNGIKFWADEVKGAK